MFRNFRHKSESSTHVVIYVCIHKGDQLKSKLQHTGIWSSAVWPSRHMCYRPAVFCRQLCVIALSVPKDKLSARLQIIVSFPYLLRNRPFYV